MVNRLQYMHYEIAIDMVALPLPQSGEKQEAAEKLSQQ